MSRILKSAVFVFLAACAGCETLPPGNAPDGTIVPPYQQPEAYLPTEAVNRMVTSITTRCEPVILAGAYVLMVKKEFKAEKNEENRLPDQVAAELVKMKMIRTVNIFPDAKYDWILQSNIKHEKPGEFVWEMKFISHADGKASWQESFIVKEKAVQTKTAPQTINNNSKGNNETHIMERKRDKSGTEKRLP